MNHSSLKTRKRGRAQHDGRPLLSYFCGYMGKFCYHGNRVQLGSRLNDTIALFDPYKPHTGTRI